MRYFRLALAADQRPLLGHREAEEDDPALFTENWSCWLAMPVFSLTKSLSLRSFETGVSGHLEIANPGRRVPVPRASDRDAAFPI